VTGDGRSGREERDRQAERRRRIAAAFGDALPESTRDESVEGWGERPPSGAGDDEWLRSQVPPHHG